MGVLLRRFQRSISQATGISVQDFRTRLRLELTRDLLHAPGMTVEAVASRCGFEGARQLRRLWKQTFGTAPSAARR
ncbi:MAG TPA: helix-turn-helix domain-containing protein [Thermoanaerobaculia bacterium]|nr:helix-turn-helix domain-containing protein [Thermoanaerobaculia bacterium]